MAVDEIFPFERCWEALERCNELDSDDWLQAQFMGELEPWQKHLRDAGSPSERIDLLVHGLYRKKLIDGRSALALLLKRLADRKEGTGLGQKLKDLSDDAERCFGEPAVKVPVVVVAMTHTQAEELLKGSAFRSEEEKRVFETFQKELEACHISNLADRYGSRSEDWRPIIASSSNPISALLHKPDDPLELKSFSSEFFSEDNEIFRNTCEYLNNCGVLLIVDVVSLFHPDVVETIKDATLSLREDFIAISIISPLHPGQHDIQLQLEELEKVRFLNPILSAAKKTDQAVKTFDVNDERAFKRWLFSTFHQIQSKVQERYRDKHRKTLQDDTPQNGNNEGSKTMYEGPTPA
jgi:hypothetical protein